MPEKKGIVVNGLILRTADCRENDRMLTVLTDELGKISVLAKGIKSLRNKNRSACQMFTYSELVLNERDGFYTLSEAAINRSFASLSEDIEASALACYVSEAVDFVCMDGVPEEEILRLALNVLYMLSEKKTDFYLIKTVFELRLALCLGILPDFSCCTVCGKRPDTLYFSETGESVLCLDCLSQTSNESTVCLTGTSLDFLRYEAACPPKKIFSFACEPGDEVGRLSEKHLTYSLSRRFRTLDFYYEITKLGKSIAEKK